MNKRLGLALLTLCAVSGAQAVNFQEMPVVGHADKLLDTVGYYLDKATDYAPYLTTERFVRHENIFNTGDKEDDVIKASRVRRYSKRNYTLAIWTVVAYNTYKWLAAKCCNNTENENN